MSVDLIQALLLAFAVVVILMPAYIRFLQFVGMGKQIQGELPQTHQVKAGVPTMGGLLLIAVVLVLFVLLRGFPQFGIIAPLATLLLVGALGAVDDYLNAKTGEGIHARQKMLWLVVVGVVAAFQIQRTYAIDVIAVPFVGSVGVSPAIYIAIAAFAIIASANGVNITDGLDGLAGGTLVFAFVAYLLIAVLNEPTQPSLASLCALIIGALLGFLWFNVHPAQVIMGDSGSLALGATLAVTALITGQVLVLPFIGLVCWAGMRRRSRCGSGSSGSSPG
jgi:phospho-N-acetylmuramoyl-pentapeptide-transferase